MWSILASPLALSADVRRLREEHPDCLELLLNDEIIAVNQDEAALPARVLYSRPASATFEAVREQAFARPLAGGRVALLMLNRANESLVMSTPWSALRTEIPVDAHVRVRDVIARRDADERIATDGGAFTARVASHDVVFVVLS